MSMQQTGKAVRISADNIGEIAAEGVQRALNSRRMAELSAQEVAEVSGGASFALDPILIKGIPWGPYDKLGAVSFNPQPEPPGVTAGF